VGPNGDGGVAVTPVGLSAAPAAVLKVKILPTRRDGSASDADWRVNAAPIHRAALSAPNLRRQSVGIEQAHQHLVSCLDVVAHT
jgi:hypothetical protein